MTYFDWLVQRERRKRYRWLKKLFKARRMARKYVKHFFPISLLDDYFRNDFYKHIFTSHLAKEIVDRKELLLEFKSIFKPNLLLPRGGSNIMLRHRETDASDWS